MMERILSKMAAYMCNSVMKMPIKRSVDKIIYVSPNAKKLIRLPGIVIENHYDPDDIIERNRNWKEVRFFFIGRFEPFKGIKELIAAFLKLSDKVGHENVGLYIAGSGEIVEEVVALMMHYKWFVKPRYNISYLEWLIKEEVHYWYANTDVFVLSSTELGCPFALINALANGQLVITSLPFVEHMKTGLKVRTHDVQDIYEKMLWAYENFGRAQEIAKAGRESIRHRTYGRVVKEYEAAYEEAM